MTTMLVLSLLLLNFAAVCYATDSTSESPYLRANWGETETAQPPRAYQQCAGKEHTGRTDCDTGWTCVKSDDWYSQCRPESDKVCDVAGDYTVTATQLRLVNGEVIFDPLPEGVLRVTDYDTGFFEINTIPYDIESQVICAFKMEIDINKPERVAQCLYSMSVSEFTFSADCKSFVIISSKAAGSNTVPYIVRGRGTKIELSDTSPPLGNYPPPWWNYEPPTSWV